MASATPVPPLSASSVHIDAQHRDPRRTSTDRREGRDSGGSQKSALGPSKANARTASSASSIHALAWCTHALGQEPGRRLQGADARRHRSPSRTSSLSPSPAHSPHARRHSRASRRRVCGNPRQAPVAVGRRRGHVCRRALRQPVPLRAPPDQWVAMRVSGTAAADVAADQDAAAATRAAAAAAAALAAAAAAGGQTEGRDPTRKTTSRAFARLF